MFPDTYYLLKYIFLHCVSRTKLDEALSQWQTYDELFNDLSTWLKDFETRLKQEVGLHMDLKSKQCRLDAIKVMLSVLHGCGVDFLDCKIVVYLLTVLFCFILFFILFTYLMACCGKKKALKSVLSSITEDE